jgi:hypothetical protein
VFVGYFYLSSYLPLLWGSTLAQHQIVDLQALNPFVGAAIGVLAYEFLIMCGTGPCTGSTGSGAPSTRCITAPSAWTAFGAFYFSPLDTVGFTFLASHQPDCDRTQRQAVTYAIYATTFLAVFQHINVRTPQWLGYIVQRPESHSLITVAAFTSTTTPTCRCSTSCSGPSATRRSSRARTASTTARRRRSAQLLLFKDIAAATSTRR